MRPTIDEQLSGIERLLEQIGAGPALSAESELARRDARRQLGRLRGSLALRAPFLRWDTAASLAVLRSAESQLSDDLRARVAELSAVDGPRISADAGEDTLAERNDAVRTLLGEAIEDLVDPADADARAEASADEDPTRRAALRRIVEHLIARTAANPALNKNPTIPAMPDEEP